MVNNERMESRELQAYEAPEMFECGSFQEETGMLGTAGQEPFVPALHTHWGW
ncbi:hypothetical protein QZH56_03540 [Streptomyces olivoreticuli]|uniref:Lasso RiPP family leader peptide-containing protein n=1 Tax=Streptomyces blastmyceticus TaxID=68180 RepID=A0ABN0XIR5_9ACTN|nr:hypothetical protein [Streptomyces olivoreticuli]WKK24720.1 hypothetical protein QZH56_03540 [Streptomyces olivoreticuli]